jgi:hypothetical protein
MKTTVAQINAKIESNNQPIKRQIKTNLFASFSCQYNFVSFFFIKGTRPPPPPPEEVKRNNSSMLFLY